MNPDPYLTCPYNPLHTVPQSRIQNHLVKCERKYPPLAVCPYNATHRHPHAKIKAHVANCPSKQNFPIDLKFVHVIEEPEKPQAPSTVKSRVEDFTDDDWD